MKLKLIKIRDKLADSFWFLPAVIALLAAVGALGLVMLDHHLGSDWIHDMGWIWSGGAQGARSVLAVVAGSVMTVVSIVFSLTITTLAQTSSHYGPRVLRNFTSDRGVQFTLGVFIATFVYSLLVLRTVRSVEEAIFVPYIAVNVGVLLALAALGVLIYFIHHVSQIIQAENLIASVGRDFQVTLPLLFPERIGEDAGATPAPDDADWEKAQQVEANENGYMQRVDDGRLIALATQHDLQIKLEKRPGEFVTKGICLLRILPKVKATEEIHRAMCSCFNLGEHRTPHQDALYSLQQLVEIAAHALSPGINEPFTALTCVDWIGASLRGAAERDQPSAERRDKDGRVRVVARPVTFEEMVTTSFDQIRNYGAGSPAVLITLVSTLASLLPYVRRPADREALIRQARLIAEDAGQIKNALDREQLTALLREKMGGYLALA
ncbi:DUF2254 domain-containing protein [Rariglobus hedericola]|uniref:DUF2254 domain-containing protein n=1 Tax=Rariglobus hedericola TaxID=2597822 RepID=A0A556QJJ6_9BACT|nr:DUF2254 domain-containing protein [Rariglobus hedericola]TSJ76781.1 DUF2254 domain-containing protein [Rariglobus hedericola]